MDAPVTEQACRERNDAIRAELAAARAEMAAARAERKLAHEQITAMRADMAEVLRLLRGGIDSQETGIVGRVQKIEDERRTAGWILAIIVAGAGALGGAIGKLLK